MRSVRTSPGGPREIPGNVKNAKRFRGVHSYPQHCYHPTMSTPTRRPSGSLSLQCDPVRTWSDTPSGSDSFQTPRSRPSIRFMPSSPEPAQPQQQQQQQQQQPQHQLRSSRNVQQQQQQQPQPSWVFVIMPITPTHSRHPRYIPPEEHAMRAHAASTAAALSSESRSRAYLIDILALPASVRDQAVPAGLLMPPGQQASSSSSSSS